MVLAALLLVMSIPQVDDAAKAANVSAATAERSNSSTELSDSNKEDVSANASLPSAPAPKVKTDAEAMEPNPAAQPFQPVKPALKAMRETPRQRKIWYGLMMAGHSGAAFDAWSTRRAISGGYAQEANPLLRPFVHSNAIYAAIQVSPAFMDFLGKRMMVSQHPLLRKFWWLPQTAGAGFSFAAGAHNVGVVH
ncbi:MAG TPA: hypothetical protein VMO76_15525 [Candidatus Udaeobacter sp.]|nr:hypothetical protein [Candidatus Udaeobacter sp.]